MMKNEDMDKFRKNLGDKELSTMYFKIYTLEQEIKELKNQQDLESKLRDNSPGLNEAWEKYQILLNLALK